MLYETFRLLENDLISMSGEEVLWFVAAEPGKLWTLTNPDQVVFVAKHN